MLTLLVINIIVGAIGASYMGVSLGSKAGRALNRKIYGKYARHNEIVTIKRKA